MKIFYNRRLVAPLLVAMCLVFGWVSSANGTTLNEVFKVTEHLNVQAKSSQAKIDALTEETRALLSDYKIVLKEIEGLRVYNRQLERQISNQEKEMKQIGESLDQVTVIERQITPLMLRMVDGLDQFIALDIPFLLNERKERVALLRQTLERADVLPSEKFSAVFRAFQIENDYGRTMLAYTDKIDVAGAERIVDVFKLGRIVLVYQSSDGAQTGAWDSSQNKWVELDDSYKTPVRNAIRMARKQLSVDLLTLPIQAPGAAE
ncbi:MAG: DUF3450 domain-containing protein [Pseudomonadales bacterium]|nr:DUF3450 domain-containing protein [Pseudomonadales bacterium]